MATTQFRACWKCEYFNGTRAVDNYGECRCHPPQVVSNVYRKWPNVLGSDWCGQYKPQTGNETQ
jgi:hypothetical protein